MSDVPVLTFTEEERHVPPCYMDPIKVDTKTFYVTIVYPNGTQNKFVLGSNYDSAITQFLAMVESYRYSTQ